LSVHRVVAKVTGRSLRQLPQATKEYKVQSLESFAVSAEKTTAKIQFSPKSPSTRSDLCGDAESIERMAISFANLGF
jgi:hypothetical protein